MNPIVIAPIERLQHVVMLDLMNVAFGGARSAVAQCSSWNCARIKRCRSVSDAPPLREVALIYVTALGKPIGDEL